MLLLIATAVILLQLPAPPPASGANVLPPVLGPAGLVADHGGRPLPAGPGGGTPPPSPAAPRTLDLQVVGQAPPHLYQGMAFGDSDHDGQAEVGMYINDNGSFSHRIYETPGGHVYAQVAQGPALIPYGIGDADGDGLAEIMGQWSYWLYTYEATSANGHPDHLAWQSPAMTNVVGYATFADADGDGRTEILHTQNPFSGPSYLMVFENTGGDAFALVFQALLDSNGAGGPKVVADFDGDGRREIATSTLTGKVAVFENTGDNAYVESWTGNLGTFNAYACALGHDMDGNGKPEFVVGGSSGGTGYVTSIYEATGDDSYAPVQTITVVNGYFGVPFNATGDVDADGMDELVIETAYDMYVYEASGPGSYVQIAHVPQPVTIMNGVACADGDRNGFDEIYWQVESNLAGPPTLIYESAQAAAAGEARPAPAAGRLAAAPSPFATRTLIRGGGEGEALRIYDAGGRLVRALVAGGAGAAWDGRDARGRRAPPGVYMLRAGEKTARAKVVLAPE